MPYTAVQDNVEVSLAEVKEWLRLNDYEVGTVATAVVLGSNFIHLSSVEFLKKNQYLTVNDNSYLIESVDYDADTAFISPVAAEDLSVGTPVSTHPHDRLLLRLIDATKSEADNYLNNSFPTGVPPEVKTWVLRRIAVHYDRPEAGVSRVQVEESGAKTYADDIYADINHLRLYPL